MAKPPEPIDEVIPGADAAVLAEVTKVVVQDPEQPASGDPHVTSGTQQAARQVVELKVTKVIFGKVSDTVQVTKPAGAYALRPGNKGPFVLGKNEILGRFGPDTWPEAAVVQAASRHGKS